MLYDIAKEYVPYLPATIKQSELTDKNDFEYLENMVERPEIKIIPKTNMISYTKNADDVILESMIMYHYQCSRLLCGLCSKYPPGPQLSKCSKRPSVAILQEVK